MRKGQSAIREACREQIAAVLARGRMSEARPQGSRRPSAAAAAMEGALSAPLQVEGGK